MKKSLKEYLKDNQFLIALTLITLFSICIGYFQRGYNYDKGYMEGGVVGYEMALDTVNKIMNKTEQCDTCVSKVIFVTNNDTTTYFLSKKLFTK